MLDLPAVIGNKQVLITVPQTIAVCGELVFPQNVTG